ncbi:MAG TPA: heat-inducible transcription repressor HrcA [Firmicutes bacterium]|nr:heat-inducible transcription repressor HrcA [Bacillota bacterium]
MLDERKRLVLRAVIDSYIETAEPVGSRTIARKHDLGVSSATIRNEMADLEETGYLQQPHVSAGRIPSDKGYRFYVDTLMEPYVFSLLELQKVQREIGGTQVSPERSIHEATKLLALLTQSVSLIVAPSTDQLVFKHVQLAALEDTGVLVTLVLHPGIVKNRLIRTKRDYSSEQITEVSDALNQKLKGVTFRELGPTMFTEVIRDFGEIGRVLVELILQGLTGDQGQQVYASGTVNILNQPEFRDVDRAIAILEALEQKDHLLSLLSTTARPSGVQVVIGHENLHSAMQGCSLVTCTYYVGSDVVGTLGVIGPTRMDYARVVAAVDVVSHALSSMLTEET